MCNFDLADADGVLSTVKTRRGDKVTIFPSIFLNEEDIFNTCFIISLLGPLSFLIKCSVVLFYV